MGRRLSLSPSSDVAPRWVLPGATMGVVPEAQTAFGHYAFDRTLAVS